VLTNHGFTGETAAKLVAQLGQSTWNECSWAASPGINWSSMHYRSRWPEQKKRQPNSPVHIGLCGSIAFLLSIS